MNKAAFLDRDGVINHDAGYVFRAEDFVLIDGVISGLLKLAKANYKLIIITNQSGIARGYYSEKEYKEFTKYMLAVFSENGIVIDAVYHCPHLPPPGGAIKEFAYACECRKPKPGMILQAAREHQIDLKKSILFGDKQSDIDAGMNANIGRCYRIDGVKPDLSKDNSYKSLYEAVAKSLKGE